MQPKSIGLMLLLSLTLPLGACNNNESTQPEEPAVNPTESPAVSPAEPTVSPTQSPEGGEGGEGGEG